MSLITAALFDLDGTLIANEDHVIDSYNESLEALNLPIASRQLLRNIQGKSFEVTAAEIGVPDSKLEEFAVIFWEKMAEFSTPPVVLPGVFELLEFFYNNNIPMGILTNNRSNIAKNACSMAGLSKYFQHYLGSNDVKPKPAKDGIIALCESLNVSPCSSVLYIGDSVSDVLAAHNAGVTGYGVCCMVDYEKRFTSEVIQYCKSVGCQFTHFLDSNDLVSWLKSKFN
ncbi:hypothetical protein RCL1_007598 [Eukaryota sp. TZLM3-RCL]